MSSCTHSGKKIYSCFPPNRDQRNNLICVFSECGNWHMSFSQNHLICFWKEKKILWCYIYLLYLFIFNNMKYYKISPFLPPRKTWVPFQESNATHLNLSEMIQSLCISIWDDVTCCVCVSGFPTWWWPPATWTPASRACSHSQSLSGMWSARRGCWVWSQGRSWYWGTAATQKH